MKNLLIPRSDGRMLAPATLETSIDGPTVDKERSLISCQGLYGSAVPKISKGRQSGQGELTIYDLRLTIGDYRGLVL
jgi:hypothetical protein